MLKEENGMTVSVQETDEWVPDEFLFASFTGDDPACFSRVINYATRQVRTMAHARALDRFLLNYPPDSDSHLRTNVIGAFLAGLYADEK